MSPINREPVALLLLSALFAITLPFSFACDGVCTATGFELYTDTLYSSASTTVYYDEYYSESCGWFGWSTCDRTRVASRTEYYMVSYTQPAYRSVIAYQCCAGFVGSPATSCLDINECAPNGGLGPCAQICTNIPGSFQCSCNAGYTLSGYACNVTGFKICFKELEGSDQCQLNRDSCSTVSSDPSSVWTSPFRDDTDYRSGGCQYQWSLAGTPRPDMVYRVCFKETEGSSQCQLNRNSCSGWSNSPSWSPAFRDDTDERSGGCTYQWRIEEQMITPRSNISACRVCFQETEGSSQCQGNRGPTCSGWSTSPAYTDLFRDDTDGRSGGCAYQWFFECK